MAITLNDHMEQIPSATRPIVEAALALVRSAAADAEEAVYQTSLPSNASTMWKLVRHRLGGEYVTGIGTFKDHVNLFFYRGLELSNEAGLLEGGGKQFRSVTLRSPADAEAPAVRRLVADAFALSRR